MNQRKLPIHIILDNYDTHKHPAVRRWFTAHPRYHVHFTPTGASWLNHAPNPEVRLRSLLGIIPQLETHHGEVEGDELVFPNGFVLEVIDLGLADNVADALREFGFTSFVETPEGFQACK